MKKDVISAEQGTVDHQREQDGYGGFLAWMQNNFDAGKGPIFTTTVTNLWDVFLANLPEYARQHYTCHACRHFVDRYGGLVRIEEDGTKYSAIFFSLDVPSFFGEAIAATVAAIAKARVNGVFMSSLKMYGTPVTGEWHHMAIKPTNGTVWASLTQEASQRAAEKAEEYKMLMISIQEFPVAAVNQALKLLESDALYRSEKVLGVAKWLKVLHTQRENTKNAERRNNITWLAVATAPAGFCHVRSSMIGTLLDDIVSGIDIGNVSRRFAEKMHPLQYQRPQAAPTAGNIAQAEKIMDKLGAAGSLERRFARVEELKTLWVPVSPSKEKATRIGVFSHLTPKNSKPEINDQVPPANTMTWEKFNRTVLPNALAISYLVTMDRRQYSAITTATNDDAPPILQWDTPERRNPFGWYFYNGGSMPGDWNLMPGWCNVTAVCYVPTMWQPGFNHHSKAVYFILDGAKDTRYQNTGNAIFPEILKAEFHGIRSTIEAYSRSAVLGGYDEASACGIVVGDKGANIILRVITDLGTMDYRIDRWD